MCLIVVDENLSKLTFELFNIFCIENRIPIIYTKEIFIKFNSVNYFFPLNIRPKLNIEFSFENLLISYSKANNNHFILTKNVSNKRDSVNYIFEKLREFFYILKDSKQIKDIETFYSINCRISKKINNNLDENNININININNNKNNNIIEEKYKVLLNRIKSAFDELYKNNYINNIEIIKFFNDLDCIYNDLDLKLNNLIEIDKENQDKINNNNYNKENYDLNINVNLIKTIYPNIWFSEEQKDFLLDDIIENMNNLAYNKPTSKNKIFIHEIKLIHILHILNTFHYSLITILNFNIYSCLKELKEKHK